MILIFSYTHWRIDLSQNMGGQGQSGQVIKLFQITRYVNDFQTVPDGASKD